MSAFFQTIPNHLLHTHPSPPQKKKIINPSIKFQLMHVTVTGDWTWKAELHVSLNSASHRFQFTNDRGKPRSFVFLLFFSLVWQTMGVPQWRRFRTWVWSERTTTNRWPLPVGGMKKKKKKRSRVTVASLGLHQRFLFTTAPGSWPRRDFSPEPCHCCPPLFAPDSMEEKGGRGAAWKQLTTPTARVSRWERWVEESRVVVKGGKADRLTCLRLIPRTVDKV